MPLFSQNVCITTDGTYTADGSAMLDVKSISKGMLIPRVTTAQKETISSPATGLLVFDTDEGEFFYYDGSEWISMASSHIISAPGSNTLVGYEAGSSIQDGGVKNTILGFETGESLTTGDNNTFIGFQAGHSATDSYGNIFLGAYAGYNETGSYKLIIDNYLDGDLDGDPLIYGDLFSNILTINGRLQLSDGTSVLEFSTDGNLADNSDDAIPTEKAVKTYVDNQSGYWTRDAENEQTYLTNSNDYVGIGTIPSYKLDVNGEINTGSALTAGCLRILGEKVLHNSGTQNIYCGVDAGSIIPAGRFNAAFGYKALNVNTGDGTSNTGSYNTAIGFKALLLNTTGNYSTAIGNMALHNQVGYVDNNDLYNVAIGYRSLNSNNPTSQNNGRKNVAVGSNSLFTNSIGFKNVAIGQEAGYSNIDGYSNVYIGSLSGFKNETGDNNVVIGNVSDYYNQGSQNVIIGSNAGQGSSSNTHDACVFIGYQAGKNETTSNKLYIENSASSDPLIYGNFSTDKVTINDVLKLAPRGSAPSSPAEGELYVNSTNHHIYCYLGGTWKQLD